MFANCAKDSPIARLISPFECWPRVHLDKCVPYTYYTCENIDEVGVRSYIVEGLERICLREGKMRFLGYVFLRELYGTFFFVVALPHKDTAVPRLRTCLQQPRY